MRTLRSTIAIFTNLTGLEVVEETARHPPAETPGPRKVIFDVSNSDHRNYAFRLMSEIWARVGPSSEDWRTPPTFARRRVS